MQKLREMIIGLYNFIISVLNILSFPVFIFFVILSLYYAFIHSPDFLYSAGAVIIILVFNHYT